MTVSIGGFTLTLRAGFVLLVLILAGIAQLVNDEEAMAKFKKMAEEKKTEKVNNVMNMAMGGDTAAQSLSHLLEQMKREQAKKRPPGA